MEIFIEGDLVLEKNKHFVTIAVKGDAGEKASIITETYNKIVRELKEKKGS